MRFLLDAITIIVFAAFLGWYVVVKILPIINK